MEKRRFIKKLDKLIGMKKLKTQIRTINLLFVFLVIGGAFAIYMNHTGLWLSYGIIVAAVAMIILALFLSYRIKLQVQLSSMKLDYRKKLVEPFAEFYLEEGRFSKNGSLTEREIISTRMFSDTADYKYTSCNELRGVHKGVSFINADVYEECSRNDLKLYGRLFEFDIAIDNVNPIIFTTATAPLLEYADNYIKPVNVKNDVVNRMFRVYAFDEDEANSLLTENTIYKLRQIVSQQFGKIIKISLHHNKVYVFFTTDGFTYEETLTHKHDIEKELDVIKEKFNVAGKLIDIL